MNADLQHGKLIGLPALVGRLAIRAINYWLNLITFAQTAIVDWLRVGGLRNTANRHALITQVFFTGIGALPVIALLALITALGLTMQTLGLTNELGKEIDLYARVSHVVIYEIAPLMTALVIISRSGSAITVDIGNMQLRGEMDGLSLLGIDIDDYIVAPRILAGAICQLVLAVYFAIIALYGGIVFAGLYYSNSFLLGFNDALAALSLPVIALFIVKNILFGVIICSCACYHALQLSEHATELPQQTQKAIVRALAQIFLWNSVFMVAAL